MSEIPLAASDMSESQLRAFGTAFLEAHGRAPGGLSVEVGTRAGGSAMLFLNLLSKIYPGDEKPFLFSVDPYGSKFYPPSPARERPMPVYDAGFYVTMRRATASCPFHAHFLMRSLDFFERMFGCPYWLPGGEKYVNNEGTEVQLGRETPMKNLTFCLLDGEHTFEAISAELKVLYNGWMNPKGIVCVDNVDEDPKTAQWLVDNYDTVIQTEGVSQWAVIRGQK